MSVTNSAIHTCMKSEIRPGVIKTSRSARLKIDPNPYTSSEVLISIDWVSSPKASFTAIDLRELAHELTRIAEVLEENSDG